jgi:hypothetical protein
VSESSGALWAGIGSAATVISGLLLGWAGFFQTRTKTGEELRLGGNRDAREERAAMEARIDSKTLAHINRIEEEAGELRQRVTVLEATLRFRDGYIDALREYARDLRWTAEDRLRALGGATDFPAVPVQPPDVPPSKPMGAP